MTKLFTRNWSELSQASSVLPLRRVSITWVNTQPSPSTSTVYCPCLADNFERWTRRRLLLSTGKTSSESSVLKVTVFWELEPVNFMYWVRARRHTVVSCMKQGCKVRHCWLWGFQPVSANIPKAGDGIRNNARGNRECVSCCQFVFFNKP